MVMNHMNGVWQPYVPKMGVPRGCRSDICNPREIQSILYAKKLEACDNETKRIKDLPNAAKSSLSGSGIIPTGSAELSQVSRITSRNNAPGSLSSGLVPFVESKTYLTRPQQGRVSEISTCPENSPPCRTNHETLKPPDNIVNGLFPLLDRD